jgi:lactoylglutathione lyase
METEASNMKFLWTAIYVKDLDESIAFYSALAGLKAIRRFQAGPTTEIAMMGNGGDGETLLELLCDSGKNAVSFGQDISIGFAVDSIAAILDAIKSRNIPVHSGPIETPRSKFFYVLDPNGVVVQFFQQK